MNRLLGRIAGTVVVLGALTATPAHAVLVDFTNSAAWGGADGTTSYTSATTYGGVAVTVSTNVPGYRISFNTAIGGDPPQPACGQTGLACQGDGLGINDNDETGLLPDQIHVHFSAPVTLTGVRFLDLFGNTAGDNPAEVALWAYQATLADGTKIDGSATGTDTSTLGYLAVGVTPLTITDITFFAREPESPFNTDFALAAVDMSPVPEPGTLVLLGSGLLTLGMPVVRRLRKARG